MMRKLSASELVARHMPALSTNGVAITATFADPAVSQEFFDALLTARSRGYAQRDEEVAPEADEGIAHGATRLIRTISLHEGPEPHRAILGLIEDDGRAHRFCVVREDLVRLVAAPVVSAPTSEGIPADTASSAAEIEARDDLLELAHIHTRLDRADDRIRRQQRQINTLMATYVERAHLPTGRFPSYCCQRCGEQIGWVGRFFQAIRVPLHACRVEREGA